MTTFGATSEQNQEDVNPHWQSFRHVSKIEDVAKIFFKAVFGLKLEDLKGCQ